jgi:SP family arabinose:H+ symporter-like MFS transporter
MLCYDPGYPIIYGLWDDDKLQDAGLMSEKAPTSYVVRIGLIAAMGGFLFGNGISVIAGAGPFLQARFRLSDLTLGWAASSLLAGCVWGALVSGRLADVAGRRRLMKAVAVLYAFSSLAAALAPGFPAFIMARIAAGLAVGAASILSPLYLAEISPSAIRGRLAALSQAFIVFGVLLTTIMTYLLRNAGEANWRWMFGAGALPAIFYLALLFVIPESPRWLCRAGREGEALDVLKKTTGDDGAARTEMACIQDSLRAGRGRMADLLEPSLRKVLVTGIILAVLVQFCGINILFSYTPIMLKKAGWGIDAALFQNFVIGAINVAFTFVGLLAIDRLGRKRLYMIGSAGLTIALSFLSAAFFTDNVRGLPALLAIIAAVAFFAACIGPVFWVLQSEIFPNRVRGAAMSVSIFVNWVANFIVILLFPRFLSGWGGGPSFAFVALMSLLMWVFAWKGVPETKGKSLEEIEQYWIRNSERG